MNDGLGKKAEGKIKNWLDRPQDGISFDRLYDQMTGYYLTSRNICDFIVYSYPSIYYIESKATWKDRFDFSMIQDHQRLGLLGKSIIPGCYGLVIILYASYKRAFILNIQDIVSLIDLGTKSLNIKKIDSWKIPYAEIQTIPSRKQLLEYTGSIETYMKQIKDGYNENNK